VTNEEWQYYYEIVVKCAEESGRGLFKSNSPTFTHKNYRVASKYQGKL
jgi:hypothetical protein